MFAVEVRDHIMIAHSLPAEVFGPAQGLHGATFVVDAAFFAEELDAHGIVVDIGLATEVLGEALAPLRYRNLDEVPEFAGRLTTTEVLCRHVFEALAAAARAGAARRRRAAEAAAGDAAREPRGARLVRGRSLGGRSCISSIPGTLDDADRRVRLRPAADRGAARAGVGGAAPGARGRLAVSGCGRPGRGGGGAGGGAGRGGGAAATGSPSARCRRRLAAEAGRLRLVALVHHPLGDESGLGGGRAAADCWRRRRRRSGMRGRSSAPARRRGGGWRTSGSRRRGSRWRRPGPSRAARAACAGDPPVILSVGSLIPRKRHDVLVAALGAAAATGGGGRGSSGRRRSTRRARRRWRGRWRSSGSRSGSRWPARSRMRGPELAGADIFALASEYEGYGMAFAEALAQRAAGGRLPGGRDRRPGAGGGGRAGAGRATRRPSRRRWAGSSTIRRRGGRRGRRPGRPGGRCRAWARDGGAGRGGACARRRELRCGMAGPARRRRTPAARDRGSAARRPRAHLGRDGLALDLGCGTGAACGAFPAGARWRLVDADPGLLADRRGAVPGRGGGRAGRSRRSRPAAVRRGAAGDGVRAARPVPGGNGSRRWRGGSRRRAPGSTRRSATTGSCRGSRRCRRTRRCGRRSTRTSGGTRGWDRRSGPARPAAMARAHGGGGDIAVRLAREPVAARGRATRRCTRRWSPGSPRRRRRRGWRSGGGLGSGAAGGERLGAARSATSTCWRCRRAASAQSKTTSESRP